MEKDVHAGTPTQLAADTVRLSRVWPWLQMKIATFTSLQPFPHPILQKLPLFPVGLLDKAYSSRIFRAWKAIICKSPIHLRKQILKISNKVKVALASLELYSAMLLSVFTTVQTQGQGALRLRHAKEVLSSNIYLSRQRRKNSASRLFLSGSLWLAETEHDIRIVVATVNPKLRLAVLTASQHISLAQIQNCVLLNHI